MSSTANAPADKTFFVLNRTIAGLCLVLFVAGWWDDFVAPGNSFASGIPPVLVALFYVALTLCPRRYEDAALGLSIGALSGFLTVRASKYGIIFALVKPSPVRTAFYYSNLLLLGSSILTWVICFKSLKQIRLVAALLCSFGVILCILVILLLS